MEKRKCSECGLLAARHDNGSLEEVIESPRSGDIDSKAKLICIVMAADLVGERAKLVSENPPTQDSQGYSRSPLNYSLHVISVERECGKFLPYQPGYTPRERNDMHFQDEILKRQEENERKSKDRDRIWSIWQGIGIAILTTLLTLATAPVKIWLERISQPHQQQKNEKP